MADDARALRREHCLLLPLFGNWGGAHYTTRQIAEELNRKGFATWRGTAWRFQYVAEALRAAYDGESEGTST